ncbi:hypothetical protein NE237_024906 [Protea cynaroides]|uniref:Uncharacterized protein n=1 Tax=Protea cynaroides TaxID=273540 RepID=A0A9Q0H215_9MAGN|nr:hypothetical protein NE237_024906 [Protea cynaroides]
MSCFFGRSSMVGLRSRDVPEMPRFLGRPNKLGFFERPHFGGRPNKVGLCSKCRAFLVGQISSVFIVGSRQRCRAFLDCQISSVFKVRLCLLACSLKLGLRCKAAPEMPRFLGRSNKVGF